MKIFISWADKEANQIARQLKKTLVELFKLSHDDVYFSEDDYESSDRFKAARKIRDYDVAIFLLNDVNKHKHCINLEFSNFCVLREPSYIDSHVFLLSTKRDNHVNGLASTEFLTRKSILYRKAEIAGMFKLIAKLSDNKKVEYNDAAFNHLWGKYLKWSKVFPKNSTDESKNNIEKNTDDLVSDSCGYEQDDRDAPINIDTVKNKPFRTKQTVSILREIFDPKDIRWVRFIPDRLIQGNLKPEADALQIVMRLYANLFSPEKIASEEMARQTVQKLKRFFSKDVAIFVVDCMTQANGNRFFNIDT